MANSSHTINGVSFLRHILYKYHDNQVWSEFSNGDFEKGQ